jgi:hypothetical protein
MRNIVEELRSAVRDGVKDHAALYALMTEGADKIEALAERAYADDRAIEQMAQGG